MNQVSKIFALNIPPIVGMLWRGTCSPAGGGCWPTGRDSAKEDFVPGRSKAVPPAEGSLHDAEEFLLHETVHVIPHFLGFDVVDDLIEKAEGDHFAGIR